MSPSAGPECYRWPTHARCSRTLCDLHHQTPTSQEPTTRHVQESSIQGTYLPRDCTILSYRMARQKSPWSFRENLLEVSWGDDNSWWTANVWTEDSSKDTQKRDTDETTWQTPRYCLMLSESKISVWWPGISQQLAQLVENFPDYARDHRPSKKPLITSTLPVYP